MPLGTVLGPQANTVVVAGDANLVMDLDKASAKVLATFSDLSIGSPGVLIVPILGGRVPGSVAQALRIGALSRGFLKDVVDSLNCGIECRQERAVAETPMTVDGTAPLRLRARDRHAVGRTRRRRSGQLLYVRGGVFSGGHVGSDNGLLQWNMGELESSIADFFQVRCRCWIVRNDDATERDSVGRDSALRTLE